MNNMRLFERNCMQIKDKVLDVPSDCGNGIKRKAGFVQKLSGGQQGYPVKGIAG